MFWAVRVVVVVISDSDWPLWNIMFLFDYISFEIQLSARQQEVYALFVTHTTFSGDITRVQCSAFLNCDHSDQVFMDVHLSLNKNQEMAIRLIMDTTSIQVCMYTVCRHHDL